jgi:3-deoxy-D-manno-octulosonate 8-phosphate phosphatase (KDO 8-P phosphatase)
MPLDKKNNKKTLAGKLKAVRLLILDVDGVLTDGKLVYNSDGIELKFFDVKDGYGLVRLKQAGVKLGIITAKTSAIVETRARDLGIDKLYQNVKDKLTAYEDIRKTYGLLDAEIAYIGDDVPDLGVLRKAGVPIAVHDAVEAVRKTAVYTTRRCGGNGAVREVAELILEAKGLPPA